MANWREILPHKPGRLILDIVAFAGHLVRLEREDGLPRIVIRRLADGAEHAIAFDEEAYSLGMSAGYEFDTTTLRFTYSSMTTPAQVFDYDMEHAHARAAQDAGGAERAQPGRLRHAPPAGAGSGRRDRCPSPCSTARTRRSTARRRCSSTAMAPTASPSRPAFSTTRLSLVDRGFVFAIAHIRGGKDKGYRWYTDGKLKKKVNTFTDFIAAGEYLVKEGYTSRGRIVANGGSAGGMLMGVVANMAPDLFLGIIADVPFVDVLNTMLDETLPLTPPEWPEWGNPIASKEDFATIRSYSPYDNVAAKAYPHIFAYARPDRPARHLLGARQVDRAAAAPQHQRQPDPAQDQHGGRPRRRVGPLRAAQGGGARLRLLAQDRGQGLGVVTRGCRPTGSPPLRRGLAVRAAPGRSSRAAPCWSSSADAR